MADTKIVVVENDRIAGERVKVHLEALGFEVTPIWDLSVATAAQVLEGKPGAILLGSPSPTAADVPGMALDMIRNQHEVPVISLPSGPMSNPSAAPGVKEPGRMNRMDCSGSPEPAFRSAGMGPVNPGQFAWYRIVAEIVGDPIFIVNRDRVLTYANESALAQFGTGSGFVPGTPYLQVFSAEFIKNLDTPISRIIWWGGRIRRTDEVTIGGRERWFDTTLIPLKGEDGSVVSVLVVCRDATSAVEAASRLRDSDPDRILWQSDQVQAFCDEVRGPLQVIRALLEHGQPVAREKMLIQLSAIESNARKLGERWDETAGVIRYPQGRDAIHQPGGQEHIQLSPRGGANVVYDMPR